MGLPSFPITPSQSSRKISVKLKVEKKMENFFVQFIVRFSLSLLYDWEDFSFWPARKVRPGFGAWGAGTPTLLGPWHASFSRPLSSQPPYTHIWRKKYLVNNSKIPFVFVTLVLQSSTLQVGVSVDCEKYPILLKKSHIQNIYLGL